MNKINLNQNLTIHYNKKIIYQTAKTQVLYLYPLTLKDYVDNLRFLLPIKIDIIKVDKAVDYNIYFHKDYFKNLLCAEIVVDNKEDLDIIKDIINILYDKKIKISLNIKKLNIITNKYLKEISSKVDYFKIFFDYKNYDKYLKKISIISANTESLIHIKSYLKLEEIDNYEKYIKDFDKYNVGVYQLSKELLPLNKENVVIDKKYEHIIRKLEKKYTKDIIFKSVKNLKELYYPRFELDERNSRTCYACRLKPYLYKDTLIPCKVNKMINNIEEWEIDLKNPKILERCGIECDDCASIYENDILGEISVIIKNKKNIETFMERDDVE